MPTNLLRRTRFLPALLILLIPVVSSAIAQKTDPPAEPPAKKAEKKEAAKPKIADRITVFGKVVDAETGRPVKKFVIQGGRFGFDPKDPKKHSWGFSERRSRSERFSTTVQWNKGWTSRIVADGYEPQPVLTKAPPPGKERIEVTIRLKPGKVVRGVVLDHKGNPVPNASVFAVSRRGLNLVGQKARSGIGDEEDKSAVRVQTGKDGRFELRVGEGLALAVATEFLECWQAEIPDGNEPPYVIQLPEPGTLSIRYNIEGADNEGQVFYQLLSNETKAFHRLYTSNTLKIPNGEGMILRNLPPATYQITRYRLVRTGMMGMGRMLDRQRIKIESGKTTTVRFIRPDGQRVSGVVLGLKDTNVNEALIRVIPERKPGKENPTDRLFMDIELDARATNGEGRFTTEKLPPGRYEVLADVYVPLTGAARFSTGIPRPRYVGTAKLTVPESGDVAPIEITLKDTQAKDKAGVKERGDPVAK